MKYVYFYSNSANCTLESINLEEVIENNGIFHSKEIKNKTINKEKGNNKFLHIFKEHKLYRRNYL